MSAAPHIHPQIDLRSAADLLSRAGFALPVADQDMMSGALCRLAVAGARYARVGVGNALAGPRRYFRERLHCSAGSRNGQQSGRPSRQGRGKFIHLHLSGWAPSADQPQPAKRGSGKVSLATISTRRNRPKTEILHFQRPNQRLVGRRHRQRMHVPAAQPPNFWRLQCGCGSPCHSWHQ